MGFPSSNVTSWRRGIYTEGLAKTSPSEDVFKQLGFEDTRTPEEKVFSYRLTQIKNNNYVQTLNVYFELEKYYLKRKGEKKDVI